MLFYGIFFNETKKLITYFMSIEFEWISDRIAWLAMVDALPLCHKSSLYFPGRLHPVAELHSESEARREANLNANGVIIP